MAQVPGHSEPDICEERGVYVGQDETRDTDVHEIESVNGYMLEIR